MKIELYPDQNQTIEAARNAFREGYKRPLVVSPTGSGKTVMATYIAQAAANNGNNVMFVVHRNLLVEQTSKAFQKFGLPHGIIQSGRTPSRIQKVQIASIETLVNRMHLYQPDLIILDEAHHATASTWQKILSYYHSAKVIGLTATPERLDGSGLGTIFDSLVEEITCLSLIQQGRLCRPKYFVREEIASSALHQHGYDYDMDEAANLMSEKNVLSNVVDLYRVKLNGKSSIAFCCNIKHAELTAQRFNEQGYNACVIEGKTDKNERARMLDDLATNKLNVLVSVELINEGVDVPVVEGAILLRHTQSLTIHLQQIGRVLRKYDGKEYATILDCVGNCNRHLYAETIRNWSLDGKKRSKKQKDEEIIDEKMRCPKCYAAHEPNPICPECGHVYEKKESARTIEEKEGSLVEVDDFATCFCGCTHNKWDVKCPSCNEYTDPKRRAKAEVGRARTLQELLQIQEKRGYKAGWANYVYASRR